MPVPAAGTFTASDLLAIQIQSDRVWANPIAASRYMAKVEAAKAILAEQQSGSPFRELQTDKDNTVRLVWLNACSDADAACTDDCTIGGAELSSDSKDYSLNICRTAGFSVKEKRMRNNAFAPEEQIALGMLNAGRVLDEYLNKQVIAHLETFRGTNEYLASGWANAGGDTTVPAAQWDKTLIPKLVMTGIKNRFSNPFILSGENLWYEGWDAAINQANADGKGDAATLAAIRRYHDLFHLDAVVAAPKTYLIEQGAVAIVSKSYYDQDPKTYFSQMRYAVASRNIPGLMYDVVYNNVCASNEITHNFSLYLKALVALNPTGCSETRTGLIAFEKV